MRQARPPYDDDREQKTERTNMNGIAEKVKNIRLEKLRALYDSRVELEMDDEMVDAVRNRIAELEVEEKKRSLEHSAALLDSLLGEPQKVIRKYRWKRSDGKGRKINYVQYNHYADDGKGGMRETQFVIENGVMTSFHSNRIDGYSVSERISCNLELEEEAEEGSDAQREVEIGQEEFDLALKLALKSVAP